MTVILWTKKWAEDTQKHFQFFNTVQSSNITAKSLKNIPKTPLLLMAQEQTHPYGRKGKKWTTSDFMATWTWKNSQVLPTVFSPLLGLALYNTFQRTWPSDLWSLKAPNDIYLAGAKTAGLLLETQAQTVPHHVHGDDDKRDGINRLEDNIRDMQVICGLGINVLKASSNAECIQNHYKVTEFLWRKFLDHFWKSFTDLIQRNVSAISMNESQALEQALKKHLQYKNLIQVEANGSLIFKNKIVHWIDL